MSSECDGMNTRKLRRSKTQTTGSIAWNQRNETRERFEAYSANAGAGQHIVELIQQHVLPEMRYHAEEAHRSREEHAA